MQLLDAVFVPDHILEMLADEAGREIMREAGKAHEVSPQLFEAVTVWGFVGAPVGNQIDEGRRTMALDILALVKCAQMQEMELDELIAERLESE